MGEASFAAVWERIASLEGQQFRSSKGAEFTYRFCKTYLVVSSGSQSIPRTYFEKVFRRREAAPALPGHTFILGILSDPRLE